MTTTEILELFKTSQQKEIIIPSSGKKLNVSPISTAQLRDIVQASTQHREFNWGFISAIYNILKVNCSEPIESLLETDIIYLIFSLTKETEALKQTEAFKTLDITDKTIEDSVSSIIYGIPTGESLKHWVDEVRGYLFNKDNTMDGVVGIVFLLELCKHIKKITINGEEQPINVDVVSVLPYTYITPILKYIEEHKDLNITNLTTTDQPQGFDISLFI